MKKKLVTETNVMIEVSFISEKQYDNPFMEVVLAVEFSAPDGSRKIVPAFWAGGDEWKVRYATPIVGTHVYRSLCSDSDNAGLHTIEGLVEIEQYTGNNPLYCHGPLQVAADQRHFEHADGTPFFWLGDTWWKCLSKRLSFDEFKELTDDRLKKGFSLAQIVCGPYPDEDFYTDWWDNEGGKPYLNLEFTMVNPEYFKFADQRFEYMVQSGIVPAIVGAWGREDCDAMKYIGVEGMKRHWYYLIARYGAYPAVWIAGGEAGGDLWTETSLYIRTLDPYKHPITVHPLHSVDSVVDSVGAECIDFDFLQTGHGFTAEDLKAINRVKTSYNTEPVMPVLIGEHSYEEHMKTGPPYTQRYVFWGSVLTGAAGLTYGAAGIWHAGVEGFPASVNTYDFTTWRQGMNYPGAEQMGLNARFIAKYPWEKFKPHPDWVEQGLFAAGIPGKIRIVYIPRPSAYRWAGIKIYDLEENTPFKVFFFDPSTGRTFDRGVVMYVNNKRVVFQDDLSKAQWLDCRLKHSISESQHISQKGDIAILVEQIDDYLSVEVDAKSHADAGIVLNYIDDSNFLLGYYSSSMKKMFFHEVIDGDYGSSLGAGDGPLTNGPRILPQLDENITLTVTLQNNVAILKIKNGEEIYSTSAEIQSRKTGNLGLWLNNIENCQKYNNFKVLDIPDRITGIRYLTDTMLNIERVPSPQDWVLVMEKI